MRKPLTCLPLRHYSGQGPRNAPRPRDPRVRTVDSDTAGLHHSVESPGTFEGTLVPAQQESAAVTGFDRLARRPRVDDGHRLLLPCPAVTYFALATAVSGVGGCTGVSVCCIPGR